MARRIEVSLPEVDARMRQAIEAGDASPLLELPGSGLASVKRTVRKLIYHAIECEATAALDMLLNRGVKLDDADIELYLHLDRVSEVTIATTRAHGRAGSQRASDGLLTSDTYTRVQNGAVRRA